MFHFSVSMYNYVINVSFNTFQVTKVLTHSLLKTFLSRFNAKWGNFIEKPSEWRIEGGKTFTLLI